ncbi:DUF6090 family protein [Algibacter sp. R77976]|uniref:DUF6090 family protein n=1 Tax=Algibacter sp. R77976 TaxID=3093873 RepID=UPI0037CC822C
MIKIFRRLRQRLLSENKFSKYLLYAIGEIILVVIGILIALQINNWSAQKKEHEALNKNLLIIKSNIEDDILMLDSLKTRREKLIPLYKKEQLTFFNNTYDVETSMQAVYAFDGFNFNANLSGFNALQQSPYLSMINGSSLHKLLIERKLTIDYLSVTENETNTGVDNLEAQLEYTYDMKMGYTVFMNAKELQDAQVTFTQINAFLKELHNSVFYRNAITKASVRDETIIPKYDALIQLSKKAIAEINKATKNQ